MTRSPTVAPVAAMPLTLLERAWGIVLGPGDAPMPPPRPAGSALAALEAAMLPALRRPPCAVSFSGGRDSSAVLAAAVALARREGLPLPIPITLRFAGAPATEESEWQELVVSHLKLPEWQKIEVHDELEVVGPYARRALARHGLLWPINAYVHLPIFDAARGGSVLTGAGGDDLFEPPRGARAEAVITRRLRPELRDLRRIAFALAPGFARAAVLRHRFADELPWLRPAANRALRRAWAAEDAGLPRRWTRRPAWLAGRRYLQVAFANLDRLARAEDVMVVHPLADRRFTEMVGARAAVEIPRTRADLMTAIFGEQLPDRVLQRRSKAVFDQGFWRKESRDLAAAWTGEGVDGRYVDLDALAVHWRQESPIFLSYLLLQAAWLAGSSAVEGVEQPGGRVAQL